MKMKLFLLLACTFILGACGSTPHTLVPSYVKLKPLSQEDLVRIVDATQVPVVPENSLYLGTMQTEGSPDCSFEKTAQLMIEKARSLGANLVYINKVKTINFVYSTGVFTTSRQCDVALVDYLNVEEWSAK